MMKSMFATLATALLIATLSLAADWPAFRGSRGGIADDGDLPVKWTADNFLWKKQLPGPGSSSPITYGNKVFVTCYSGYGTKLSSGMGGGKGGKGGGGGFGGGADEGGDQKNLKLHLLCFDRKTGELLWKKDIEPKLPEAPFTGFMREHGYATSTPVTDGERIYVFFGKSGVSAFTLDGAKVWTVSVGTNTDMWGSGASPIVADGVVIVNAAIESGSLVGLDAKTGAEKWRTKGVTKSWSSPVLVSAADGKSEVALSLGGKVIGYDPKTGAELWRCKGIGGGGSGGGGGFGGKGGKGGGGYTSSTPVARDGVLYVTGGGGPNPAVSIAIKAGGRGEVDDSHVLWRKNLGTGIASPILVGDRLCWISGTVTALSTKDGSTLGSERLYNARQEYVSPVLAGDKIFALTRGEGLYVLDSKLQELAHNEFKGDTTTFNASPAITDGLMFIRSNQSLYCIGKK